MDYFTEIALDDNILGQTGFMKSIINNEYNFITKILDKLLKEDIKEDLKEIFNLQDSYGNNPLMIAIENENLKIVKYFLEKFGNIINLETNNNLEDTALFIALKKNNEYLVKELVLEGSKLETLDVNGNTALFVAINYSSIDIIKFLILYGANTRPVNNYLNESPQFIFDIYRFGDDSEINFATLIENIRTERDIEIGKLLVEKEHRRIIKSFIDAGLKKRQTKKKSVNVKSKKRQTKKKSVNVKSKKRQTKKKSVNVKSKKRQTKNKYS